MGLKDYEVTSKMMEYNRKWILEQFRSERQILDNGNDLNRKTPSIFYQMEPIYYKVGEKMISEKEFIMSVKKIYSFLINEFNYSLIGKKNRTNLFYDVEYQQDESIISISYENREDYLQIILFRLNNGTLPNYDDKEKTFHLENLNKKILSLLSIEDFEENIDFFSRLTPLNQIENRLLKSAKELRLCLKNIYKLNN